jgi:hypothetical protein
VNSTTVTVIHTSINSPISAGFEILLTFKKSIHQNIQTISVPVIGLKELNLSTYRQKPVIMNFIQREIVQTPETAPSRSQAHSVYEP